MSDQKLTPQTVAELCDPVVADLREQLAAAQNAILNAPLIGQELLERICLADDIRNYISAVEMRLAAANKRDEMNDRRAIQTERDALRADNERLRLELRDLRAKVAGARERMKEYESPDETPSNEDMGRVRATRKCIAILDAELGERTEPCEE